MNASISDTSHKKITLARLACLCLYLATRRDPRKLPTSTAVLVLAFPTSYLIEVRPLNKLNELFIYLVSITLLCKNNLRAKIYSMHIISAVRYWVPAIWLGWYFSNTSSPYCYCLSRVDFRSDDSTLQVTTIHDESCESSRIVNNLTSQLLPAAIRLQFRWVATNCLESWSASDESTLSLLSRFKNEEDPWSFSRGSSCHVVRIDSMRIESSRQVPQANRLKFVVKF